MPGKRGPAGTVKGIPAGTVEKLFWDAADALGPDNEFVRVELRDWFQAQGYEDEAEALTIAFTTRTDYCENVGYGTYRTRG